jgi:hypothetical protein
MGFAAQTADVPAMSRNVTLRMAVAAGKTVGATGDDDGDGD